MLPGRHLEPFSVRDHAGDHRTILVNYTNYTVLVQYSVISIL